MHCFKILFSIQVLPLTVVGHVAAASRSLRDGCGKKGGKKGKTADQTLVCGVPLSQIQDIIVFGDSFSDTGNVFGASNDTTPAIPYFDGRYSNGRNYVDFLSQKLKLPTIADPSTNNFAWGGATTDNDIVGSYSTFLDGPVPAVKDQLQSFLNLRQDNPPSTETTIYIIYAAYNDYWWYMYRNTNYSYTNLYNLSDLVSSSLIDTAQTLVDQVGAKQLLIADLVDMSGEPEALTRTPEVLQAYDIVVGLHNAFLREKILQFQHENKRNGVQAVLLPVYSIFKGFVQDATCLGYEQVQVECLTSEVCPDPLSHIFWDAYHPQTMTHKYLSEAVLRHLSKFE